MKINVNRTVFKLSIVMVVLLVGSLNMSASQGVAEDLPVVDLLEDADVVAVVEFIKGGGSTFLVKDIIYPQNDSGRNREKVLGFFFANYDGKWYGTVSSGVTYRDRVASSRPPIVLPEIPFLVFLVSTETKLDSSRRLEGPSLILPFYASVYQFSQWSSGLVPLVNFDEMETGSDLQLTLKEIQEKYYSDWEYFSVQQIVDEFVRPDMIKHYGVSDGRVILEAYRSIFALILAENSKERVDAYMSGKDNSVFERLMSELLTDISISVSKPNVVVNEDLDRADSEVVDLRSADSIMSEDLRKELDAYTIVDLDLHQVPLSIALKNIEELLPKSSDSNEPVLSFRLAEGSRDPSVSPSIKGGVKLGFLLHFLGIQSYIRFEKEGSVIVARPF